MIDNRPLQTAAWTELARARKRLAKATRDVHRHEEVDEPAFQAWLANAFPTLLSAVRMLAEQIEAKRRIVEGVESEAFYTRRPAAHVWREWQQNGGQPAEPAEPGASPEEEGDGNAGPADPFADLEAMLEEELKRMFAGEESAPDDACREGFGEFARETLGLGRAAPKQPAALEVRDVYRRLVRHLHPDRGGEWTPARARLWEQVQEAWLARDGDWLARLEAEWEAHADLLGPTSPVGRLRTALTEIDAARRDTERRVRAYRKHPAWRFSLGSPSMALHERLRGELQRDQRTLRAQLDELEAVIGGWERRVASGRGKRRRAGWPQDEFGF